MLASAFPNLLCLNERSEKRKYSGCLETKCFSTTMNMMRKRPRIQRKVRFLVDATGTKDIRVIIPRSLCIEDLPRVWYSRQDYRVFQDNSKSLALAFELGVLDCIDPEDVCLRGLEANLSKSHLEARLISRGALTECILRTQEFQKGQGTSDPELIRGLSMVLSKDACEDALKLAAYDREEADEASSHQIREVAT